MQFYFIMHLKTTIWKWFLLVRFLLWFPAYYNISGEEKTTKRKAESIVCATFCFHNREAIGKGNYPLVPKKSYRICPSGHKQRPFLIIPEGKLFCRNDRHNCRFKWMSKDGFLIWTLTFVQFVQNMRSQVYCGKDKDAILFLDSHSSRINPAVLLIVRLYKIHVSTHNIQPFDKSLVAPFKREYRKIQSSLNNDVSNIIILSL